ncbi:glycosyltransferase family 9 protein [Burkholderia sp. BCC1977]|uniref:glycosyltransferase family 9 protein n=1 Tax=Burkholderia sp. BCC1977 TaxID=2817440 RepID=UPI002ABE6583|nr:glycosyltransferase family 9 protein [Burkholderia sp. BCC1977]
MNAAWRAVRRILCMRLDNVAGVLMTTPAMRALKESREGRHLTLLTSSVAAPLADHLPMIDDVLAYDAPWLSRPDETGGPLAGLDLIADLLTARYDAAVIFTVYSQSALPAAMMCWLAGIRLRLAHCRENPFQLLTDPVAEAEPQRLVRHEVVRQMALVRAVGATTPDWRITFDPGHAARRAMRDRLRAARERIGTALGPFDGLGRWLVVHPGASTSSRRWPADRFGDAAARLSPLFDGVAVTGDGNERQLVATVCARVGVRAVPFAGILSIGELGALIEAASLLISNNSDAVHLAAALGTPVVDLYALTNPQDTPWKVPNRVLNVDVRCRYCDRSVCDQPGHPCLRGVGVDDVVDAARMLLRAGRRPAHRPSSPARGGAPAGDTTSVISNVIPIASAFTRR